MILLVYQEAVTENSAACIQEKSNSGSLAFKATTSLSSKVSLK